MVNLFSKIGKTFWDNTFKAHPVSYSSVLITGMVCMTLGMGIGGCYNSKMKRERDQYRAEAQNLTQQLQLSAEQNSLVTQRANTLESALEIANTKNNLYSSTLEQGAEAATKYGNALFKYAETLRSASKKISISQ